MIYMTKFVTWRIMDLVNFQRNFKNMDINIIRYIKVVSIFITGLFVILLFNNKIEDYYLGMSKIVDKKIEVIIDIDNVNKIKDNNKIIIERNTFTYEIEKIEDYLLENNYYKKIYLSINDIEDDMNNQIVKYQIITNESTILEYLFKTLKGDD